MDTQPFELLARLTPALHDTGCACGVRASQGALRAEARRQLRWQQRALARTRTTPTLGTPYLVVPAARAGLAEGPDWLRQAGEEVPSWFDHGRSLVWTSDVTLGTASVRLADLLGDITPVLAWFDFAPRPLGADADVAGEDPGARERA